MSKYRFSHRAYVWGIFVSITIIVILVVVFWNKGTPLANAPEYNIPQASLLEPCKNGELAIKDKVARCRCLSNRYDGNDITGWYCKDVK